MSWASDLFVFDVIVMAEFPWRNDIFHSKRMNHLLHFNNINIDDYVILLRLITEKARCMKSRISHELNEPMQSLSLKHQDAAIIRETFQSCLFAKLLQFCGHLSFTFRTLHIEIMLRNVCGKSV